MLNQSVCVAEKQDELGGNSGRTVVAVCKLPIRNQPGNQQRKSRKGNNWALLVINNLTDGANEIEQLANILREQKGFPTENIIILRAEEATRSGIITAIRQLVEYVSSNDTVVIRFSDEQGIDKEIDWWLKCLSSKTARCIW